MKYGIFLIALLSVAMLILAGCEYDSRTSDQKNQDVVESNNQKLIDSYPIPDLTKSLERKNLIERAKVLNDDSKVFYVYLISHGKVVSFFTARNKVSSLNSYLNPQEKVVSYSYGITIDSPDIDGSYGENAKGVFFFTTDGAYVEWMGEYLASDFPLKITTPIELTREIKN